MIDGSTCSRMKLASLVVNYITSISLTCVILKLGSIGVFKFLYSLFILFISYTSEPAKGTFILAAGGRSGTSFCGGSRGGVSGGVPGGGRSEEHTSELQSQSNIVC